MRWKEPNVGEKRIDSWFAWYPIQIGNEIRWWEKVTVESEYIAKHKKSDLYTWQYTRFVDKE